jgi:hypothetical protein
MVSAYTARAFRLRRQRADAILTSAIPVPTFAAVLAAVVRPSATTKSPWPFWWSFLSQAA